MTAEIAKLLSAQFITALADNAILFVAVAMVLQGTLQGDWYIPALQACFLVAFVLLAPWVGAFADSRSKPQVLWLANLIKAVGAGMMLMGINPLLAYAMVGVGAAAYSPAKYGILPELVNDDEMLVKVNGWVEGSTIVAILLGTVLGAYIADQSIVTALLCIVILYVLSALIAYLMRPTVVKHSMNSEILNDFKITMVELLSTPQARFVILSSTLFWTTAVVLRLMIIVWASAALLLSTSTDISLLTLFIALGIALGALLAPRLIPLTHLHRTKVAAYGMGLCILLLLWVDDLWWARSVLFAAGICGGLFIVPINAVLQDIGHRSVGSGRAVAVQHFFENIAMLSVTALYAWVSVHGVPVTTSLLFLGLFVWLAMMLIGLWLPKKRCGSSL